MRLHDDVLAEIADELADARGVGDVGMIFSR
jgi:hypothetical protein